eukprot:8458936-Alexandrium_andersonii.AAC.1
MGAQAGTNNTGELTAICEALEWLARWENTGRDAVIYYDSVYAAKIASGEFRANANRQLAATARRLMGE